ncbi:unnamed protein product [Dovyalis caffra]|uniref:dolichyl-diphosphooligosaccharide--protein glycotransferase n=1 Tax=Dovyalis caffra TaxID=77055 RepID=A0AAV1R503_9ROSI|nr:unnamed protein product [Dovyalis caffra]
MAVTKTEPINGSTTKTSAPPSSSSSPSMSLKSDLLSTLSLRSLKLKTKQQELLIQSWYPLGRIIGGTLYPGLMVTAAIMYWGLRFLRFAVHIREVCVLTAPFFASNTTLVAYFFGKEIWDSGAGLVAAILIAICPGYISRSVAGSYDNEGVAIFALLLTFYMFVKAVNTGSLAWGLASAFGYFYMVSAWGGYVFIINLIPLYVLVLLITGRYSMRLYVAYNCMYVLGMLLAMQIRFVGFQHVQSGEHMAAMGVFFLMQVFYFLGWVNHLLNDKKKFEAFLRISVTCAVGVGAIALGVGTASGYISPWTGRFYSLLDPTYAKDHIPIIASVSEHQPTAWSSFMFDFQILLFLFPAGLYFCFKRLTDATIFIVMYGLTSMYFAGVMVRLILVATPAVCLISAIAVSATIKNLTMLLRTKSKVSQTGSTKGSGGGKASSKALLDQSQPFQRNGAIALLFGAFYLLSRYAIHCTWVTSEAYSSPSIVLAARGAHGNRVIFDDYREAYYWLRQNTPPEAKVMSWWDYGYQITAMGNRTVIVDNNTWNNTHIATVGRAMSSYEDEAYEIMRSLDVNYVLVVFGGVTGYSSDDINKFLWMVRIGGGVFPVIKEPDYLVNGEYRVDKGAAPKMLNCLMYKLSYYRFGELVTEYGKPPGLEDAESNLGYFDVAAHSPFGRTSPRSEGSPSMELQGILLTGCCSNLLVANRRCKLAPNSTSFAFRRKSSSPKAQTNLKLDHIQQSCNNSASTAGALAQDYPSLSSPSYGCEDVSSYYDSVRGLKGKALKKKLHSVISKHHSLSYKEVWDALKFLDAANVDRPQASSRIIEIYSLRAVSKNLAGKPNGWNREHLWPRSYGLNGGPSLTDLHNIRPADVNVNSSRGNKYYGECREKSIQCLKPANKEASPDTETDKERWAPPTQVRGDIARAIMYMAVCYGLQQPGGLNLHLSDSPSFEHREMGLLSTLLKWNEVDPPSREEKLRNDRVCKFYQHNRNPFVDHPEYASLIWKPVTPSHQSFHFPARKELMK